MNFNTSLESIMLGHQSGDKVWFCMLVIWWCTGWLDMSFVIFRGSMTHPAFHCAHDSLSGRFCSCFVKCKLIFIFAKFKWLVLLLMLKNEMFWNSDIIPWTWDQCWAGWYENIPRCRKYRVSDKCRKIVCTFVPGFLKQSILSSSSEYYTNKKGADAHCFFLEQGSGISRRVTTFQWKVVISEVSKATLKNAKRTVKRKKYSIEQIPVIATVQAEVKSWCFFQRSSQSPKSNKSSKSWFRLPRN
jgi:hypothetical protein